MPTYALMNHYLPRLLARTGKVYSFVSCVAVAPDEVAARELAAQHDPYQIDWRNQEAISCEEVRVYGSPAPEGFVSYQVKENEA